MLCFGLYLSASTEFFYKHAQPIRGWKLSPTIFWYYTNLIILSHFIMDSFLEIIYKFCILMNRWTWVWPIWRCQSSIASLISPSCSTSIKTLFMSYTSWKSDYSSACELKVYHYVQLSGKLDTQMTSPRDTQSPENWTYFQSI